MEVIGRDIGDALDRMYAELESRVRTEAECTLEIEPFQGALSRVRWDQEGGVVTIQLNEGVPTHALPHVLAVALQHVRQRLDRYPDIRRPTGEQADGSALVRTALKELVLAPEAEVHLASLALDQQWEAEQRHQGLKEMLVEPPEDWNETGTLGNQFAALQYARMELQHPPEMWKSLRKRMEERLPVAVERGEAALRNVRRYRWNSPGACLQALIAVRDELGLREVALIEDRRTGRIR